MDPADRKFSRNALRLELLTQEGVQRCIDEQKQLKSPVSLREIAIGLGLLSVKDAQRASRDETEIPGPERPSAAPRPRLKSVVVEEMSARPDPRAEGGPAAPPRKRTRPQTGRTEQSLAPVHPTLGSSEASLPPPARSQAPRPVNRRWDAASAAFDEAAPRAPEAVPSGTAERTVFEARAPVATPQRSAGPPPIPPEARPSREPPGAAPRADPNARWLDGVVPSLAPSPTAPSPIPTPVVPGPPSPPPEPEPAPMRAGSSSNATVMQVSAPLVSFAPPQAPRVLTEPPPPPPATAEPSSRDEPYLAQAVALAIGEGASDLHLHSGAPLMIRVNGRLVPISGPRALAAEAAAHVIAEIMNEAQRETLATHGEVEFSWTAGADARCRVSAYRQRHGIDAVLRIVPATLQRPTELGLPPELARLVALRSGIVLCAGPPGCGKSTTLAALLTERIAARPDHVVLLEAPVEHVLGDAKGFVTQREIGLHSASFPRAVRAALREDPDVLALGDLPDAHTIELVLAAAEAGRLVFATLGTTNARQAIVHLVTSFPAHARDRVRATLAAQLRAIVTQHLVPHAKGDGRSVAVELLFVTESVREVIRHDKLADLASVMRAGREDGSLTLDASLEELARQGVISVEQARRYTREHAAGLGG